MRVLLLGSGGRESAMAWALAKSSSVEDLWALPGNPGIAQSAELLAGDPSNAADALDAARSVRADLVVIGPEAPLVEGVGNALRADNRRVFGPDRAAAMIEGSKSHAKTLMDAAGIATARWRAFEAEDPAVRFLDELGPPYVVKADGLAAGKGVTVTSDRDMAVQAVRKRLSGAAFGAAGTRVVIEEYLDGPEISLIALSDGVRVLGCEVAQDYKRVFDDDGGPNTGGMGSYSPVPDCPSELSARIVETIMRPMVRATFDAGAPFVGALYAGLALTARGPRVVEFNCRFGDPEAQALLPRLTSDFGGTCMAAADGDLTGTDLTWSDDVCVCVVLASGGYPDRYRTGQAIGGLDEAEAMEGVQVFQAGTRIEAGELVAAGGRVISVSALGDDFASARKQAYTAAYKIRFEDRHLRTDIAARAVKETAAQGQRARG